MIKEEFPHEETCAVVRTSLAGTHPSNQLCSALRRIGNGDWVEVLATHTPIPRYTFKQPDEICTRLQQLGGIKKKKRKEKKPFTLTVI